MKLSDIDLVPVLTIIAGGAIGFSLFAGFLLLSPARDAPALDAVVVPSTVVESANRGAADPYMFVPFRRAVVQSSRSLAEMTPRQEYLIRILLEEQKDVSVVRP